ncbi:PAS/PAC sensor hybrid histidine kinase [Oscillochloris trichoides DG-6]|uniref:histidine kinase n=1 Tax=Oscillochloris trichoides DG-6 TaxID=765420 RepID=E1ICR6_9CHLR|nr:ATP-binding protein [Oscillochloris trichoides]EFO81014.1 PAS/PAC sensor hybrid histidine kinase [Oscillochloris trichoides DG-6]
MIIPPRSPSEGCGGGDPEWVASLDILESAALRTLYAASRQFACATNRNEILDLLVKGVCALTATPNALFTSTATAERLLRVAGCQLPEGAREELHLSPQVLAMLDMRGALVQGESAPEWANVATSMNTHGPLLVLPIPMPPQPHALLILALPNGPLAPHQHLALINLVSDAVRALDRIARAEAIWHDASLSHSNRILAAVNAVTDIGLLYSNVIDQMLNAILNQILNALNLAAGAILIYNDESEDLEVASALVSSHHGQQSDLISLWQAAFLPTSIAEARKAANQGQVLASSSSEDQFFLSHLHSLGVTQLISVPLLAGGWLTGVLQVVVCDANPINQYQSQILHILARQTAVAIENARLFAQTRNDQERTSAVVDATNDAILMLDERRRVMIINRRARFFFGISERELQEKDLEQLSIIFNRIFEDPPRFHGWLRQLLRSPTERVVAEFRIIRPEARLLQCFSAPVMDLHDRYLGRILVFRDITREREVERMKSEFVSNVSHELRTPLTSIQGTLQLVLGPKRSGSEGLPQRARDLLNVSLSNTERLIRLINDILDVAKIEQGRIELRRETLSVEDLCRAAVAEMHAFANHRGMSIDMDLQPGLPSVLADRDRSTQILINLLSNAIKFSVGSQSVLLSARTDGSMVYFSVRDWGRGIDLENQERIFQKFVQIDSSATRDVGGTGLGLSISKALVEEQGGRIWLESELGRGSTFTFTLPVAPGLPTRTEPSGNQPLALLLGFTNDTARLCAQFNSVGWQVREVDDLSGLVDLPTAHVLIAVLPHDPSAAQALLDHLSSNEISRGMPLLTLGQPHSPTRPGIKMIASDASVDQIIQAALSVVATRQLHVLVVDDDRYVRPVLVRLLQRHGFRVTNVADGLTALTIIEQARPDVVLLDVKMPGIDGTEVLRRIKENPLTAMTRVIILTANDLGESLQSQVLRLGADGYLEKPITYERLISMVMSPRMQDENHHEL